MPVPSNNTNNEISDSDVQIIITSVMGEFENKVVLRNVLGISLYKI